MSPPTSDSQIIDAAQKTFADALRSEPFTLAMSSGFFGFFAHAGMLSALSSQGLHPSGFSGSSAGAMVAAAAASGVSADELYAVLKDVTRADFWDVRPGLGLLRGDRFRQLLSDMLGVTTFEACASPLTLSVWRVRARETRVISSGDLPSAVHASCCFPGLLQPVIRDGERLLDGGIGDRPGLAGVPVGARTLHHHLSSKSPWRSKDSPALMPPQQANLMALVIDDLPRLSPFHLDRGPAAFAAARQATLRALTLPAAPVVRLRT